MINKISKAFSGSYLYDTVKQYVLLRTANAKATTILVACSTLLITLGVAIIMEGTNHLLYQIANAQLEDSEDLRVEQRTAALEDELQSEPKPK